jgi:hypothetical protein
MVQGYTILVQKDQAGGGGVSYKLSDANIQRLERMGFDWGLRVIYFDDRVKDLQAFKEEHGHCNVSQSKSVKNKNRSLGL